MTTGVRKVPICLTQHCFTKTEDSIWDLEVFQGLKSGSKAIAITRTFGDNHKEY